MVPNRVEAAIASLLLRIPDAFRPFQRAPTYTVSFVHPKISGVSQLARLACVPVAIARILAVNIFPAPQEHHHDARARIFSTDMPT